MFTLLTPIKTAATEIAVLAYFIGLCVVEILGLFITYYSSRATVTTSDIIKLMPLGFVITSRSLLMIPVYFIR